MKPVSWNEGHDFDAYQRFWGFASLRPHSLSAKNDDGRHTIALSNSMTPSVEVASVAEEKTQVRDLMSHRLTACQRRSPEKQ